MPTAPVIVDPKRKRVNVEFAATGAGAQVYSTKMANSNTEGTLFTLMGYTDKGDAITAGATKVSRSDALQNGLIVPMIAQCSRGNRSVTRKIYVPVNKLEETIKQGPGKTIGTLQVQKIRGVVHRVLV
jgi:hypothetical protein